MKKKLEADLISIAHRILKLKNKSELIQLHQETQKLYEKLSVLKFVEENFSDVKPTIGHAEIEEKLETAFSDDDKVVGGIPEYAVESNIEAAPEVIVEEKIEEETIETTPEIIEEAVAEEIIETAPEKEEETVEETIVEEVPETIAEEPIAAIEEKADFEPHFELFKEEAVLEVPETKNEMKQISFEDLLGGSHSEPIFERVQKIEKTEEKEIVPQAEAEVFAEVETPEEIKPEEVVLDKEETKFESKSISTNDNANKIITFGLNDKIAFEKQLFGGSSEDLNRVVSQLSTFDTFEEAQNFIEDMVKPDYNNWEGKDDYAQRFMEIVEKKFA
ncbi:hypothetical protein [Flavobacterium sp.]|uniref:hypothetical protein n=1 Tax=Flavobacterium sp. TaxID=239 RepID=UPI002B4ABCEF|nr:hypothetical protein [Flavobacterium sp.]HLF51105.1 hypothetical protein [Flavobacterium sp.]